MIRTFGRWMGVFLVLSLAAATLVMTAQATPDLQQTRQLAVGIPAQGQIDPAVVEDPWIFNGSEGDLILIDMVAGDEADLDPYLTLLAPDGSTLLTDDDGGLALNARLGPYTLPADGVYTVATATYAGTGAYTLELRVLNTPPVLEVGSSVTGTLDADRFMDYYQLSGVTASSLMRIVAQSDNETLTPIIDLYGPEGQIVSSESLAGPDINPLLLQPDTRYIVIIYRASATCAGNYELSVNTSDIAPLTPGASQTFELNADAASGIHYFQGEAGQKIRVSLSSDDLAVVVDIISADLATSLFTSSGEQIHALMVELEVPQMALYAVQVRDNSHSETPVSGSYTLTLENIGE